jgi:hypothetical protein
VQGLADRDRSGRPRPVWPTATGLVTLSRFGDGIAVAGLDLGLTVLLIGLVMVGAAAHHLIRSPVARGLARA